MGYLSGYLGGYAPDVEVEPPPPPAPISQSDMPRALLEIDIVHDVNPASGVLPLPTWTDFSSYLRAAGGVAVKRGRQRSRDRNQTGVAVAVLSNRDGTFEPDNPDSPIFPSSLLDRRARVSALTRSDSEPFVLGESVLGGTDVLGGGPGDIRTQIMEGVVDELDFDYPQQMIDATVTLTIVDAFAGANEDTDLNITTPLAIAGDRINYVLNKRAWSGRVADSDGTSLPSPDRDIYAVFSGGRLLAETDYANQPMLDILRDAAFSEGGNLFVSRDGRWTYLSRTTGEHLADPGLRLAVDAQRYREVAFTFDKTNVANIVTVTSPVSADVVLRDEASISHHKARPVTLDTLLFSPADMDARGAEHLIANSEPQRVVTRLDLSNIITDWRKFLAADLWARGALEVEFLNGRILDQEYLVEGIEIAFVGTECRFAWWVSVAPTPNLLTDNQADFELLTTAGWVAEDNCTIGAVATVPGSGVGPVAVHGVASMYVTPQDDGDVSVVTDPIAVVSNTRYFAAAHVKFDFEDIVDKTAHVEVDWLAAGGAVISTSLGEDIGPADFGDRGRWFLATVAAFAPPASVSALLRIVFPDCEVDLTHGHYGRWVDVVTFKRS